MASELGGNLPTLKWKRPDTNDYPKVWYKFKARDVDSDNFVDYRIQDLPLDRVDDLFEHLIESFLPDEPAAQAMDHDPHGIDDYMQYLKPIIAQRMVLVCFKEGSDEIVGANLVFINTKDDTYALDIRKFLKGHIALGMFEFFDVIWAAWNTFEKYNVSQYMASMGLSVARKYRRRGIGTHFLNSRLPLCREFGITLIQHTFSSDYSNICADRAGYNTDMAWRFTDIADNYPQFEKIANAKSKQLTLRSYIL